MNDTYHPGAIFYFDKGDREREWIPTISKGIELEIAELAPRFLVTSLAAIKFVRPPAFEFCIRLSCLLTPPKGRDIVG